MVNMSQTIVKMGHNYSKTYYNIHNIEYVIGW